MVHDNHRPTYTASIARDEHRSMVMIDVYANELAEATRAAKFAEILHEAGGIAGETNDGTVHVDDVGMRAVNLSASRGADV